MSDIFTAPIVVPAGGFRWVKGIAVEKNRPGVFLTNGIPQGVQYKGTTYSLETNPVLFRQFAELDPEPGTIRAFADRWGSFDSVAAEKIQVQGHKGVFFGTRQEAWRAEIRTLQRTLQNLESAKTGKEARQALDTINKRLRLLARPRIQLNHDRSALALMLQVGGVLGVVWSQLARYIDERKIHLRCAHCAEWFEVQSKKRGMAQHQKYCSKNCATNASRARKRKAQTKSQTPAA